MTEAEWLACADPMTMLSTVVGKTSDRKLRLFACACCRVIWDELDPVARATVCLGEDFADGLAGREKVAAQTEAVLSQSAFHGVVLTVWHSIDHRALPIFGHEFSLWRGYGKPYCALIREVIKAPVTVALRTPALLPSTIPPLAQAAYDERSLPSGHLDPARLAVLSDALEEAGCDDAALLAHLRSHGPHVRGCWALDLVLGKS